MMLFRPIEMRDLDDVAKLAKQTGTGLTTLPEDPDLIKEKIELSQASFSANVSQPGNEYYLFVLEDTSTGEVVGTSALAAAVGLDQPFYTYKLNTLVHASRELNTYQKLNTLFLTNDFTGKTEICTLFLAPSHRKGGNGRLLSKARFLFLALFPDRFAEIIFAEMRGFSDENGISPFWESLGRHFFDEDFATADAKSGEGDNRFIAELMPEHPIYVPLLTKEAQEVIGKVHKDTRPALQLLKAEGFRYTNYVDIFDAGPTIEAHVEQLKSVANATMNHVQISDDENIEESFSDTYLLSNTDLENFRSTLAFAEVENGITIISQATAELLSLNEGDVIRTLKL